MKLFVLQKIAFVLAWALGLLSFDLVYAAVAPGGFMEKSTSSVARPLLTPSQIAQFLPAGRGKFIFPSPYNTEAYRVTIPADCPGNTDCVNPVGYSYWRNMNNSANSNTLYFFLTLYKDKGGEGPTLFSLDKTTGVVTKIGPLFGVNDPRSYSTGEIWYFSATMPTVIYLNSGSVLSRFDILSHTTTAVFDLGAHADVFGTKRVIWQMHSSNNDQVHSFTVLDANYNDLGCGVFLESSNQFKFYPTLGINYDECQIDKSGRYLMIKEDTDDKNGNDDRIIDLQTGLETRLLDENGAMGHSDMGFGYAVGADNWYSLPATRLWKLGTNPVGPGTVVYKSWSWNNGGIDHLSFANARSDIPIEHQYACGSGIWQKEAGQNGQVVCFKLDGSLDTLVVAPILTDVNASGGGDEYGKYPKGNLDPTGQYFIWTSNLGGSRLDALIVRVPSQLLSGAQPTPPPAPTPNPSPSPLKGDINKDGIVNSLDWSLMNSKWFSNDTTADLNNDGIVNSLDFSIMNGNWSKTI